MWKNLLGKKRHWIGTCLEIIVPTVLFMALVALRTEGGEDLNPKDMNATTYPAEMIPMQYCNSLASLIDKGSGGNRISNSKLLYFPQSSETDKIMNSIEHTVNATLIPICRIFLTEFGIEDVGSFSVMPVNNSEDIQSITDSNAIGDDPDKPIVYGGVIFNLPASDDENQEMKYTMRFAPTYTQSYTGFIFPPYSFDGPQDQNGETYDTQTAFQALIDLAYIESITGEQLLLKADLTNSNAGEALILLINDFKNIRLITALKQMAFPAYLENNLAWVLSVMFPLFLVLSFAFIAPPVLKRIVYEKETGVKELMKMMGLPSWLHWLCWFINSSIISTISIGIIVALVHVSFKSETGAILAYSDPSCTFIFLFLYASALITQLFVLSTLFNQPNLALGIGVLFHILSFFISSNVINQSADTFNEISLSSKLGLALIPNVNLIWGVKMMMGLEGKGNGVQWSTLNEPISVSDDLTMGTVWIMFLVDILLYSFLIWYIDNVRPGKYGVAKPLYFPFLLSTYMKIENKVQVEVVLEEYESDTNATMFEPEPNLKAGIRVKNLRKEFKKFRDESVVAVDQVSFSAYEGEITTLLGHNGAGKTTTMSVLTGLFSATGGQATINGYDISLNMNKVRESLGLCPQHNMLFEDLTVREHLVFFGMLKGMSKRNAEMESKQYIEMLNLIPKRNVIVTNLSGGMKRKVNLGIALIGGSKVVMLDEPTSGMDPEARRGMWDLLLSLKADRTILLTTHFMEEADVLGDRIAIMARGKVQCYGTPFFLKGRFGSGYTLTVSTAPEADKPRIKEIVNNKIPGTKVAQENGEYCEFSLPIEDSPQFPNMFETLESKSSTLGIEHIGLSLTTMEDVFLKIGEMTGKEEKHAENIQNGSLSKVQKGRNSLIENDSRRHQQGIKLTVNQLKGLFSKRGIYTYRRPILYIVMMLVPIGMAIFNVLSLNTAGSAVDRIPPDLSITLGSYIDPITLVSTDATQDAISLSHKFSASTGYGVQTEVPDIDKYIIDNIKDNNQLAKYKDSYIISGEFKFEQNLGLNGVSVPDWNGILATGIFNSVPLHSKPLAQEVLSNGILRFLKSSKYSIKVSSHPLKETNKGRFENIANNNGTFYTFGFGIVIPIGISILVSAFLIFPLNERATSAKQVQVMAGLHPGTFWIANLVWDNLLYLISGLIMFGLILALDDNKTFEEHGAPGALLLVIFLLGLCGIPFSYATSFVFNTAAAGFSFLIIINILAGSIAPTAVFLLRQFGESGDSDDLVLASDIVRWIFTWFPIFPFSRSLMAIVTVQESNKLCTSTIEQDTLLLFCQTAASRPELILNPQSQAFASCCQASLVGPENVICDKTFTIGATNISIPCHEIESFFTWDPLRGINTDVLMLFIDGILLFSLLVLVESKLLAKLKSLVESVIFTANFTGEHLDDDVLKEQERVSNQGQNDLLTVLNLTKSFKKFPAVKGLSFGVKPGECFGLLGINGAGKTTSFRMLTGDETPTEGLAMMMGQSLDKTRRKFLKNIGYCPQFDSIIPELTGRELLKLMSRVRGIPPDQVEHEVERWTNFLGIQEYIDRESGSYSGGNKRKLNVAMSLVGEPPIVFLDEPSTGVDPVARRNLWNIIKGIQANGQAVVLTSHSMEECEALCDRLGIMVNGQFQCFGTVPHLKNKFAQGFTLLVKLKDGLEDIEKSEENVLEQVVKSFPKTSVKDRHRGYLQFSIEDPTIPLHVLFRTMEGIKGDGYAIEEYSINETTLEQVFLSFAKKQLSNSRT